LLLSLRDGLRIAGGPAGRSMSSRGRRAGKGKYSSSRSRSGVGAGIGGTVVLGREGLIVVVRLGLVVVTEGLKVVGDGVVFDGLIVGAFVVCVVGASVVTVG